MKKLTMITAILLTANLLMAQIINIPDDYPTIQEGIYAASDGDTVLVQPGTYFENLVIYSYQGKITLASLFLTTGDTSYISQTIIDGNEEYSVFTIFGAYNNFITITGFTIQNGTAGYSSYNAECGGGISYRSFEPIIDSLILKHLIIKDNYADKQGGGIYLQSPDYESLSYILIEDVVIENNYAGYGDFPDYATGGGIYCENLCPVLNRVRIAHNDCGGWWFDFNGAGGCFIHADPVIMNTVIHSNGVDNYGYYGIYFMYSSPLLQNILVFNNNFVEIVGGYSDITIQNATIYGESVGVLGEDGIYIYGSSIAISNSIIWGEGEYPIGCHDVTLSVEYSNIKNGMEGVRRYGTNDTLNWLEGNIDEDPLFLVSGNHPYQLSGGSPCIDAGTPDTTGLNLPCLDLMGNYRLWDGDFDGDSIVDMGAYEFGSIGVGIEEGEVVQDSEFEVQCYPNPFSSSVSLTFDLIESAEVSIQIFNTSGENVSSFFGAALPENQVLSAGKHSIHWDNEHLPRGIYFCRVQLGNKILTKKIVKR